MAIARFGARNSMGRVTLSRVGSADVQQRQIYARIDDGPSYTLMFGDSVSLEIPAGEHRLRANNTLFWKSLSFTLAPGEHTEFAFTNKSGLLGLGFLGVLGVGPFTLAIERRGRSAQ